MTEACLARIGLYEPKLNAFITVCREEALAGSSAWDAELAAGHWRGPLHGIPLALKDLIDTAGIRTTGGSALFKGRVPEADATVTVPYLMLYNLALLLGFAFIMFELVFGYMWEGAAYFPKAYSRVMPKLLCCQIAQWFDVGHVTWLHKRRHCRFDDAEFWPITCYIRTIQRNEAAGQTVCVLLDIRLVYD